jgi:hypothetical protein
MASPSSTALSTGSAATVSRIRVNARIIARRARRGETKLTAHCLGCYHQAVKTFEELRLWNDMIFVDVPKHRRLVCSQCGSSNVKVMPIFPPAKGTPGYVEPKTES